MFSLGTYCGDNQPTVGRLHSLSVNEIGFSPSGIRPFIRDEPEVSQFHQEYTAADTNPYIVKRRLPSPRVIHKRDKSDSMPYDNGDSASNSSECRRDCRSQSSHHNQLSHSLQVINHPRRQSLPRSDHSAPSRRRLLPLTPTKNGRNHKVPSAWTPKDSDYRQEGLQLRVDPVDTWTDRMDETVVNPLPQYTQYPKTSRENRPLIPNHSRIQGHTTHRTSRGDYLSESAEDLGYQNYHYQSYNDGLSQPTEDPSLNHYRHHFRPVSHRVLPTIGSGTQKQTRYDPELLPLNSDRSNTFSMKDLHLHEFHCNKGGPDSESLDVEFSDHEASDLDSPVNYNGTSHRHLENSEPHRPTSSFRNKKAPHRTSSQSKFSETRQASSNSSVELSQDEFEDGRHFTRSDGPLDELRWEQPESRFSNDGPYMLRNRRSPISSPEDCINSFTNTRRQNSAQSFSSQPKVRSRNRVSRQQPGNHALHSKMNEGTWT